MHRFTNCTLKFSTNTSTTFHTDHWEFKFKTLEQNLVHYGYKFTKFTKSSNANTNPKPLPHINSLKRLNHSFFFPPVSSLLSNKLCPFLSHVPRRIEWRTSEKTKRFCDKLSAAMTCFTHYKSNEQAIKCIKKNFSATQDSNSNSNNATLLSDVALLLLLLLINIVNMISDRICSVPLYLLFVSNSGMFTSVSVWVSVLSILINDMFVMLLTIILALLLLISIITRGCWKSFYSIIFKSILVFFCLFNHHSLIYCAYVEKLHQVKRKILATNLIF